MQLSCKRHCHVYGIWSVLIGSLHFIIRDNQLTMLSLSRHYNFQPYQGMLSAYKHHALLHTWPVLKTAFKR